MATGKIKKLVHLSQQTYLPNTRLVPDHNDKGYGLIQAEDGRDVYFPHEVVEGRRGFDDLRRGQVVEYTSEVEQIEDAVAALSNLEFTEPELVELGLAKLKLPGGEAHPYAWAGHLELGHLARDGGERERDVDGGLHGFSPG